MKKRAIGILLTLTMLLSLLPVAAFAATEVASGTCGAQGNNLTWSLDSDGVLTISGTGAMANWDTSNKSPWSDYSISKDVVILDGVTSVGSHAFYDCSSLTSVTIPDSVTSINHYAFAGCTSLTSITIPDSVTSIGNASFASCSNLINIVIPSSVTSIGYGAFNNCISLTNVTIPSSVASIGHDAFHGCTSLTSVTIPSSVTSIGYGAFANCTSLTAIIVDSGNENYKDIGGVLFSADGTLLHCYPVNKTATSYSIPSGVTNIGDWAFCRCASLTSVAIPSGVTSIEQYAFASTNALTDIYFGGSAEDWDTAVGTNYIGLADTVTIHYNSTAYTITWLDEDDTVLGTTLVEAGDTPAYDAPAKSGYSFYGWDPTPAPVEADATYTAIYHPTSSGGGGGGGTATIAEGYCGDPNFIDGTDVMWELDDTGTLTISGKSDMANWDNYTDAPWYDYHDEVFFVVVEDGVTSIGDNAFEKVYANLAGVEIASTVTRIGLMSFAGCSNLTSMIIPEGVTDIGSMAFAHCSNLSSISLPSTVENFNGEFFFNDCDLLQTAGSAGGGYNIEFAWEHHIPDYAFSGCKTLQSIEIPSTVLSIGAGVFSECESLTSLNIPADFTFIGGEAFFGTTALTDIYFDGSESKWNAAVGDRSIGLADSVTIHFATESVSATSGGAQYVGSDGTSASVSGTVISADPDSGTVNISGVELTYANGFNGVKLGEQVEGKSVDIDLDRSGRIATYEIYIHGKIKLIEQDAVTLSGDRYAYSDSLADEDRIAPAWLDEYCDLYLDGKGEVIGWWISNSGSGSGGITMVSDTGYVEDGVKYTYASSFVGDKLTGQVLGCDVGSWSRDSSGAITRIYYVTYYGSVKAADTNGVTLGYSYGDGRTFPYASSFAGSKLGEDDVGRYVHLYLNAKGEITDYSYQVDGKFVSADSNGVTMTLDSGETATYLYPSGYNRTKLTNAAAEAAGSVHIHLNSNGQIDYCSLSGAYGYIIAADPAAGTVSILESDSAGDVRTYTCDSNFNGAPVSKDFIGCRISTSLNINGKLSWYHIYADDKNDFRSQTLPNAVKFVPYSVNLLDVIKSVYPEGDCTYQVTSGLPAWLTVNKDTSELSGIPTETGSCGFQMKVTVGTVNETWVFTLDVKDNTTAAVTQEVAPELKIEQTVSNMTTTNLTDQVFEIEDKVEDENESNFDKFMEVYLDGVLLVGGKIGENETVKTVEDVPDEWEYYAEEGSTKITVRAQTFEKKAAAGTHTIAATFSKTDPETGEQTTMTAAQNFTISTPGGGGSSSSSRSTKNETKDNGTIKYTVKDGVAQLDAKSMDKLTESAKENSVLTLDFTTAGQTVTTAKLPAGMIDKLVKLLTDDTNKAQSLVVKLTSGALTFDAASLAEIAKQTGGAELSLSLNEVAASSLPVQQQEALTVIGAEKVFSIEIKAGDKQITGFGGGRVTLGVPFTVPAERDSRGYAVWHLAENGGTTRHSTAYADGSLSFRTAHFSYYAVAYQEAKVFNDVPNGLWFASDVNHMVSLGLMSGVGGSSFAPDMELNRAMVAQILYNLEKAEAGASAKFEDVPASAWYADAVNWAAEAGVVEDVGNGRFEPMRAVTRGELVVMLYKYATYKQYNVSNIAALGQFPDSADLSDWAKSAMQWAVGTRLISGINGKLADQETATRAQAAKVLTYFLEMYEA